MTGTVAFGAEECADKVFGWGANVTPRRRANMASSSIFSSCIWRMNFGSIPFATNVVDAGDVVDATVAADDDDDDDDATADVVDVSETIGSFCSCCCCSCCRSWSDNMMFFPKQTLDNEMNETFDLCSVHTWNGSCSLDAFSDDERRYCNEYTALWLISSLIAQASVRRTSDKRV